METLQRTANRGSISTGGYDIDNSCKFEDDNSEWFSKTTGSDWNRVKWTASFWVKRGELGATSSNVRFFAASDANYDFRVRFQSTGDTLAFYNSDSTGSCSQNSTAVFRDTSAWYHIVAVWDTANSTAGNRQRLYVNGVEITDFATDTQPAQNQKSVWGKTDDGSGTVTMGIGAQYNYYSGFTQGYCGYMAEWHWVEGQALSPTDFGEYDENSGIWKPKEYEGTYGTNGFYLDFEDASDLGADSSGNGNHWTKNNITSANQATDTPTNNFCTWNPLQTGWNTNYGTGQVIVEGATEAYASTNYAAIEGSMAVQSGKWYWESKPNRTGGIMVGVAALNGIRWAGDTAYWYLGMNAQGIGTILGNFYYNGSVVSTDATDWTNGDIVSIALDMDNYKIYMAVNGSWGGTSNPATGTGGYDFSSASNFTSNFVVPAGRIETANSSYVIETNFGGYTTMSIASGNSDSSGYGNFEYAPPSGYYALCSKNLAEFG